jgi:hypothetical protein
MTQPVIVETKAESAPYWPSLKQAIATSSGFKNWLAAHQPTLTQDEDLVLTYLRQTLATLAY